MRGRDFELSGSCMACEHRRHGFFCDLSAEELRKLDAVKRVSPYPRGAVLFWEQQAPRGVYVLCKGDVKLSFTSKDGRTMVLGVVNEGDLLGLEAALANAPYEATAETLRPCQIAFIGIRDFQEFVFRHPQASRQLARYLSLHYRKTCAQLRAVGFAETVKDRMANFLLDCAAPAGEPQSDARFVLPLSHQEIAEYIGTTRESVTRSISELRNRGLVEKDGGETIIHRSALRNAQKYQSNREKPHVICMSALPRTRVIQGLHAAPPEKSRRRRETS
jgi:CRP/FNR family transcriptional regulator, cyclic AMP receptor protein